MTELSSQSRLTAAADVEVRVLEGGAMMVDLKSGDCFRLNKVGSDLWQRLSAGATLAEACESLQDRYDVTPTVLHADAVGLCQDLLAAGLVVRQD